MTALLMGIFGSGGGFFAACTPRGNICSSKPLPAMPATPAAAAPAAAVFKKSLRLIFSVMVYLSFSYVICRNL
jgi:hypothetical protein